MVKMGIAILWLESLRQTQIEVLREGIRVFEEMAKKLRG
jgi:hypothetical protein